jgi:hypothetical protein
MQQRTASVLASSRRPGERQGTFLRACLGLLTVCVAGAMLMGCSLGIAKSQHLEQALPQSFQLSAPAEQVWQAVNEEASAHSDCLLTSMPASRVLSWCEEVANWRDLGQDTVVPVSLSGGVSPDAFARFSQALGKGTVVTTIWIEDLNSYSTLHVRRVYYGSPSFAGIGHSRGEYERELLTRIMARLNGSGNKP